MNFALIGYGYWGPNLARNIKKIHEVNLKYICDNNTDLVREIKNNYPESEFIQNEQKILEDKTIDAVIIATPVSTHFPLSKKFLKAGINVFVEKPLADSTDHAKELVQIARDNNLILMVGHTFLFSPSVVEIKKIIDSGTLGEIYFISSSRVNLGKHQKDVSVLWDLAPHDLSMFQYWLGVPPICLSCFGNSYIIKDIPDVAFLHLRYPENICVNLEIAWLAPSKLRRVAIVGSKKMLIYNDSDIMEKVKIFDKGVKFQDPQTFGEYQLSYRSGDIYSPFIPGKEPLFIEMLELYNSVKNKTQPKSNGEFGLLITKTIEQAEKSLSESGKLLYI